MSGYPAGAEHDSRAPYNQTDSIEDLCRYCDTDAIKEHISPATLDDDYEEEEYRLNCQAGLCENCRAEEEADNRRDER